MADHRKSFRPRRLAFDGRLLPRGRLIGAALALLGALSTPAFSQELGLKHGSESLAAGKYADAVRQLSATVNDEKATQSQAAQALMLRGIAYRKGGQPARAIVDLGAAVWLGLPTSDKVRALVNKGLAYKAAGLSSQGDAALAEARRSSSSSTVDKLIAQDGGAAVASADSEVSVSSDDSSGESVWSRLVPSFGGSTTAPPESPPPAAEPPPTRTAEAAPTSGWNASVSDEESSSSSGSTVSRWFGSLAGDSAPAPSTSPAPTPAPSPRTTTAPPKTAAPPPNESWAANTQTEKVVSNESSGTAIGRWFSRQTDSAPSAPAAPQAASGYSVQLANSRSQAEAQALWKKVQGSNQQLASASPQIEKVDIGSFGTFYSLRIGPFASQAEGTKLCNALKRNGTDCSVISPHGP